MATVGYSGTPLVKKLGIKPETKLMLINQPPDYFSLLEADVRDQLAKKNDVPDLVDVKVCAVSEIWSGLKLVVPLAKKKKRIERRLLGLL